MYKQKRYYPVINKNPSLQMKGSDICPDQKSNFTAMGDKELNRVQIASKLVLKRLAVLKID